MKKIEKLTNLEYGSYDSDQAVLDKVNEIIDGYNKLVDYYYPLTQDLLDVKLKEIQNLEARMNRAEKNLASHEQSIGRLEQTEPKPKEQEECQHESDGLVYTSYPPKLKCGKCGEFYPVTPQSEKKESWQPKEGEDFWYVGSDMFYNCTTYRPYESTWTKYAVVHRNCFKTMEEAQQMATMIKNLLKGGE